MMHKAWYSIEEVPYYFSGSSIKFPGHTGWKIDDSNPISVRLLGRLQLSNPSDLPCSFKKMQLKLSSAKMVTILSRERWVNIICRATSPRGQWVTVLRLLDPLVSVIIGSNDGLPPSLSQAITWSNATSYSLKFELKYNNFHSRKCIWTCHLENIMLFSPYVIVLSHGWLVPIQWLSGVHDELCPVTMAETCTLTLMYGVYLLGEIKDEWVVAGSYNSAKYLVHLPPTERAG